MNLNKSSEFLQYAYYAYKHQHYLTSNKECTSKCIQSVVSVIILLINVLCSYLESLALS